MNRDARDTSWHVLAFIVVVAGLSLLAPLAWWQGGRHPGRQHLSNHRASSGRAPLGRSTSASNPELPQPQVAPLGPLIADQITLDPSIRETPSIPTGRPALSEAAATEPQADSEMRLSAIARPPQPTILPPSAIETLPTSQPPGGSPFAVPEPAIESRAWPRPKALLEQLEGVVNLMPSAAPWAERAIGSLSRLVGSSSLADPLVGAELTNLKRLADEAKELAKSTSDDQARSKILRAGYALVRRLMIWDIVHALATSGPSGAI